MDEAQSARQAQDDAKEHQAALVDLTTPDGQMRGAERMRRRLVARGTMIRGIDLRLRRLQLFDVDPEAPDADRTGRDGVTIVQGGRSRRMLADHALIQLALEHRDRYLGLKRDAAALKLEMVRAARACTESMPIEQRLEALEAMAKALSSVAKVETEGRAALGEIQSNIEGCMNYIAKQNAEEVGFVVAATKFAQAHDHHEDAKLMSGKLGHASGMTSMQIAAARKALEVRSSDG